MKSVSCMVGDEREEERVLHEFLMASPLSRWNGYKHSLGTKF